MTDYAKGHLAGFLTGKRNQQAGGSRTWSRDYRDGFSDGFAKGSNSDNR
jgi:hypothetical protein